MKTFITVLFYVCAVAATFGYCFVSHVVQMFVNAAYPTSETAQLFAWLFMFLSWIYVLSGAIAKMRSGIDKAFEDEVDAP